MALSTRLVLPAVSSRLPTTYKALLVICQIWHFLSFTTLLYNSCSTNLYASARKRPLRDFPADIKSPEGFELAQKTPPVIVFTAVREDAPMY